MLKLSQASRPAVYEIDSLDEHGKMGKTSVAGEHPLTLYLDKRELVTLMTLGAEPEYLSLGYLRNQRFIEKPTDLAQIHVDWETSSVAMTSRMLADSGESLWEQANNTIADKMAHRTVTTGCGQGTVYGDIMDELASLKIQVNGKLHQSGLLSLLEQMRKHDSIYRVAGAVHGCALFELSQTPQSLPELKYFVEDVGRHNAVDAIAGWMWLNQAPRHPAHTSPRQAPRVGRSAHSPRSPASPTPAPHNRLAPAPPRQPPPQPAKAAFPETSAACDHPNAISPALLPTR